MCVFTNERRPCANTKDVAIYEPPRLCVCMCAHGFGFTTGMRRRHRWYHYLRRRHRPTCSTGAARTPVHRDRRGGPAVVAGIVRVGAGDGSQEPGPRRARLRPRRRVPIRSWQGFCHTWETRPLRNKWAPRPGSLSKQRERSRRRRRTPVMMMIRVWRVVLYCFKCVIIIVIIFRVKIRPCEMRSTRIRNVAFIWFVWFFLNSIGFLDG